MKFICLLAITLLAAQQVSAAGSLSGDMLSKLEALYLKKLDTWVAAGGDVNSMQDQVVSNCGKIFYIHFEPSKIPTLSAEEREGYDTLIDTAAMTES